MLRAGVLPVEEPEAPVHGVRARGGGGGGGQTLIIVSHHAKHERGAIGPSINKILIVM